MNRGYIIIFKQIHNLRQRSVQCYDDLINVNHTIPLTRNLEGPSQKNQLLVKNCQKYT